LKKNWNNRNNRYNRKNRNYRINIEKNRYYRKFRCKKPFKERNKALLILALLIKEAVRQGLLEAVN